VITDGFNAGRVTTPANGLHAKCLCD